MTGLVEKQWIYCVYLDFSKTFNDACHNIVIKKLMKHGLEE